MMRAAGRRGGAASPLLHGPKDPWSRTSRREGPRPPGATGRRERTIDAPRCRPTCRLEIRQPTSESATALVDAIPKVELHCHVEGTVRPATVVELARKAGRPLPVEDPTELYRYDSLDRSWRSSGWSRRRSWTRRLGARRVRVAVDAAAHGLRYREMFFTPARHLAAGQDLGEIVAGLTEGIEAEAEAPVRCRLIATWIARTARRRARVRRGAGRPAPCGLAERVIGIGADSTELGVDLRTFAPAFDAARRLGFRRTCHAGEAVGVDPANIAVALDVLAAERIDHGVAIVEDPALVRRFAVERIPLTVCPSSNVNTARSPLAEHPFAAMRGGLLVTVNTDDPAMTDYDLGREYADLGAALGFDHAEPRSDRRRRDLVDLAGCGEQAALARAFEEELAGLAA